MAKTKLYAVEVKWTTRRTMFVEARRPGGAESKALAKENWDEVTRLGDQDEWPFTRPDDLEVVAIREV